MVLAASATAGAGVDPAAATVSAPDVATGRGAQVKLADALGGAESIEAVIPSHHQVAFELVRDGEAVELIATTKHGEVVELSLHDRGPALGWDGSEDGVERFALDYHPGARAFGARGPGGLSWLGDVMRETTAVTRLDVDRDGAVMLVTSDGQRYMAIPGRGSGGNAAVEARWAAQWNR